MIPGRPFLIASAAIAVAIGMISLAHERAAHRGARHAGRLQTEIEPSISTAKARPTLPMGDLSRGEPTVIGSTGLPASPEAAPAAVLPSPDIARPAWIEERDGGYRTIAELQQQGRFADATAFALGAPAAWRRDAVIAAFHDWARQQSEAAFAAAAHLADPATRDLAVEAVLSGWSGHDPAGLAAQALEFPAGPLRETALTKALRAWMHADPWAAGDWIMSHGPHVIAIAETMFRADER